MIWVKREIAMSATRSFTFTMPGGQSEKAYRRVNPDRTLGGWVARSAKIDPSAIIEAGALVEPGAEVGPGITVKRGEVAWGSE